jgi:hypothetical protein
MQDTAKELMSNAGNPTRKIDVTFGLPREQGLHGDPIEVE